MDAIIDNSALSNWAASSLKVDVIRRAVATGQCIGLPFATLSEAMDTSDHDRIQARFDLIVAIGDALAERFFVVPVVRTIVERERRMRLNSTPRMERSKTLRIIQGLRDRSWWSQRHAVGRQQVQDLYRKDEKLARDKELAKMLRPEMARKHSMLPTLVEAFRDDDNFWRVVFPVRLTENGRYMPRIRQHPARYAAAIMFGAYGWLLMLGRMFTNYQRYEVLLSRPDRGDTADHEIAVSAAHARWLVTDDDGLRERVNHVAKLFKIKIRAIRSQEWLSGV